VQPVSSSRQQPPLRTCVASAAASTNWLVGRGTRGAPPCKYSRVSVALTAARQGATAGAGTKSRSPASNTLPARAEELSTTQIGIHWKAVRPYPVPASAGLRFPFGTPCCRSQRRGTATMTEQPGRWAHAASLRWARKRGWSLRATQRKTLGWPRRTPGLRPALARAWQGRAGGRANIGTQMPACADEFRRLPGCCQRIQCIRRNHCA
jgi:hypothetical protein